MIKLIDILQKHAHFKEIIRQLREGKDCFVSGLWGSSSSLFAAAVVRERIKSSGVQPKLLLVVSGMEEAEEDADDLNAFLPGQATIFPADETFFAEDAADDDAAAKRLSILNHLLHGNAQTKLSPEIIVAPIQALLQPVPPRESITENILTVRKGHEYPLEELTTWLQQHRYHATGQVENPGEYSTRGGIVDIFPYAADSPCRIEYFGDEVESLRRFSIESQLSERDLDSCQILSVSAMDNAAAVRTGRKAVSFLSYLSKDTWIALKEPSDIKGWEKMAAEYAHDRAGTDACNDGDDTNLAIHGGDDSSTNQHESASLISMDEIFRQMAAYAKMTLVKLPLTSNRGEHVFHVKSEDTFSHDIQTIASDLKTIMDANTRTVVFCNNAAEKQRFQEILHGTPIENDMRLELRIGHLWRGFQFSDINVAVLTDHEIFHRYSHRREPKKPIQARAIDSFLDLKKGDYVVHLAHGIGRFLGMETLEDDGRKREYLLLEFDEGTRIYVPATRIELVQKYIGSSDHKPKLDRIGAKQWEARKKRTESAVADVASDLLHIQALRNAKEGITYPKDTVWQKEFEAAFIYDETPDQLQAIEDIKRDMESKRPMDRLLCGDVGYGKTEIAMRAAFKTVMHGKQVAILVPTTILAQQHHSTFSERMADYPVTVDVLSRFKSRAEQKESLEKAAAGLVDILIGTHRLLQKDVYFKDLGLVVVDEEQRFGVAHKERLKQFRQMVDVLTLTATPIPRTLHMSLMGIKDISSLNTPPLGRQSIHTQIIRFDPARIRQAIMLELNRKGQVYFVHNRVYNIERIAGNLSLLVPEAKILIVHGQMDERLLEQRMRAFVNGMADILVSTTIIESGLDIPNANTILINCADSFGLADLHQLRGRVGRYKHRAYAYIVLPADRSLTPEAEKRIKAIEEFAELGAGFKIAMRDLEIRGAGNLLGTEQHGHIAAVGYEMYCRLLELAVRKARNEPIQEAPNVAINLNLESFIPGGYISEDPLKMDIYRRLNRSTTVEEIRAISIEMADRFGEPPRPVKNLLSESELRVIAQQASIRSIQKVDDVLIILITDLKKAEECLSHLKKSIRVINENTLHLRLAKRKTLPEDLLEFLKKSIKSFEAK